MAKQTDARMAMVASRENAAVVEMDFDDDEFRELTYWAAGRFEFPHELEAGAVEGSHVFVGYEGSGYWCVHMRHETAEQKQAKADYAAAMAAEADTTIGEEV